MKSRAAKKEHHSHDENDCGYDEHNNALHSPIRYRFETAQVARDRFVGIAALSRSADRSSIA